MRPACTKDFDGVVALVKTLDQHEILLADLQQYNKARRDDVSICIIHLQLAVFPGITNVVFYFSCQDGTQIQAYVADTKGQIVGVAIVRIEEDIEYIRSHYNIEDFVYYNHHRRPEHGHLHHFALNPVFKHYTKHFLKVGPLRLLDQICSPSNNLIEFMYMYCFSGGAQTWPQDLLVLSTLPWICRQGSECKPIQALECLLNNMLFQSLLRLWGSILWLQLSVTWSLSELVDRSSCPLKTLGAMRPQSAFSKNRSLMP